MSRRYVTGAVIGSMPDPANLRIAPSRSYPWYGYWSPGAQLTDEQIAAAGRAGLDLTAAEIVEVRREATNDEMYRPTGSPAPVYAFHCPVLQRRADGGVKVIAPSGVAKLVRPAPPHIDSDALWAVKPRGVRR